MKHIGGMAAPGRIGTHDEAGPSVPQEEFPVTRARRRAGLRGASLLLGVLAMVAVSGCSTGTPSPSVSSSGSVPLSPAANASPGVNPTDGGMMGGNQRGPTMGGVSGSPQPQRSCTAPAALPGQTVAVTVTDMSMNSPMMGGRAPMGERMTLRAIPARVPAGQVSFVVSNLGGRLHELVILPLPAGAAAGKRVPGRDGKIDETGSLGEASATCAAGTGEGISSGTVGWITVTLPPGRYELVCNLENHYANGMYQELDVT